MITLYQVEWCPYSHAVRQVMTELGITYTIVNVPAERAARDELMAVSGQDGVPVLVDGDKVVAGSDEIIAHVRATRPARADSPAHADRGRFRLVVPLALPPEQALERLRAALRDEGFTIVSETSGETIAPGRMPSGYVLVHAAAPAASARIASIDPSVPGAVTIPFAVYGAGTGSEVAVTRPRAPAFAYGVPDINRVVSPLLERVLKVAKAL